MTEFEEKVIEHLVQIEKQQASIIEILETSLDIATGSDSLNVDINGLADFFSSQKA